MPASFAIFSTTSCLFIPPPWSNEESLCRNRTEGARQRVRGEGCVIRRTCGGVKTNSETQSGNRRCGNVTITAERAEDGGTIFRSRPRRSALDRSAAAGGKGVLRGFFRRDALERLVEHRVGGRRRLAEFNVGLIDGDGRLEALLRSE